MIDRIAEFVEVVRKNRVVMLAAPTGAGKSTAGPYGLLFAGLNGKGQIAVTEPRRPAAISLAKWVAQNDRTPLGRRVGYQIGMSRQVSRGCELVYMTEGILLNRMHSDPMLSDYSIVVLGPATAADVEAFAVEVRELFDNRVPSVLLS